MIPESEATEAQKDQKVTHDSGKRSDGSRKKSKGHAGFRKAKRQKRKKIKRSRMIPEGEATEAEKNQKVTHVLRNLSDINTKKVRGHPFMKGGNNESA